MYAYLPLSSFTCFNMLLTARSVVFIDLSNAFLTALVSGFVQFLIFYLLALIALKCLAFALLGNVL